MTIISTKHRIRPAAAQTADFAPIATINTTPLIDMMLVILIMLIVSIPMSPTRYRSTCPRRPSRTFRRPSIASP